MDYGHQTYTLDFAEPTQGEDPLPVLTSLALRLDEGPGDLAARQADIERRREDLERATSASLGPLRRRLFRTLLRWGQEYGPNREEALFYIGAASWSASRGQQHS